MLYKQVEMTVDGYFRVAGVSVFHGTGLGIASYDKSSEGWDAATLSAVVDLFQ